MASVLFFFFPAHTSPDWFQIVQKSKITKMRFCPTSCTSCTFHTFQNLDHKKLAHFSIFLLFLLLKKWFKVCQNRRFGRSQWFLLNKHFRKCWISQKPAKTGSWLLTNSCYGLHRIQNYQFLIRLYQASYSFHQF